MKASNVTITAALVASLTGCATLNPSSTSYNAEKAAISTCAAAAAYKDAIDLGAPAQAGEAKAKLETLKPYCDSKTPPAALDLAEQNAFAWLEATAKPYLVHQGDTQ